MGVTALYCHINPPTLQLLVQPHNNVQMAGLWPPVDDGERCSKFEPDGQAERISRSASQ
jgi:hypothetical protein